MVLKRALPLRVPRSTQDRSKTAAREINKNILSLGNVWVFNLASWPRLGALAFLIPPPAFLIPADTCPCLFDTWSCLFDTCPCLFDTWPQDSSKTVPRVLLGGSLGRLGGVLDPLGCSLGALGAILGGSWAVLRGSWATLDGLGVLLGCLAV